MNNSIATKSDFFRAKTFGNLDKYKLEEGDFTNEELLDEEIKMEYQMQDWSDEEETD